MHGARLFVLTLVFFVMMSCFVMFVIFSRAVGNKKPAPYLPKSGFQAFATNKSTFKYRKHAKHLPQQQHPNNRDSHRSIVLFEDTSGTELKWEEMDRQERMAGGNGEQRKGGYHKLGVPELGSFPNRRTLFSGGSHRVTRVPLSSASSPRGLPSDGIWHSSSSNGNNTRKSKTEHRTRQQRPSSSTGSRSRNNRSRREGGSKRVSNSPLRARRPATARSSRPYHRDPTTATSTYGNVVQRRPRSAAPAKGWV